MHLDESVLVRYGSVHDDEDEVVVVCRSLRAVRTSRNLDGERVELEDLARTAKSSSFGWSTSIQKKGPQRAGSRTSRG